MLEQQKKGAGTFAFPRLCVSHSRKALAEIRLLVGGSRQKHLWLEKSPAPHSFLNFETPLIIQYYNLKTSVVCLCLREKFKFFCSFCCSSRKRVFSKHKAVSTVGKLRGKVKRGGGGVSP